MLLEELKQYKPYSISPGYNMNQILYGEAPFNEDLIEGTTYSNNQKHLKAIKAIVQSQIHQDQVTLLEYQHSLIFHIIHHQQSHAYIEYDLNNHRFMIACIDNHSLSLYRLLLVCINYLYNQYHIQEFQSFYETWRSLDMSMHHDGLQWDAHEWKAIDFLSQELTKRLNDIMKQPDCFLALHYDSMEELLEHFHLSMKQSCLIETFLFQINQEYTLIDLKKEKQQSLFFQQNHDIEVLDLMPLYQLEEISQLPLFLQESIQDNQDLYLKNRYFLDRNDFDLIKSFYRGKTWSCLYYGPSGTGKTTKILAVAGALGLPSMKMVGSRSIDESSLFGKYVLRNGETVFEYGPLALMMKYGGMFIFDEINMVDSDIISSLNDVLDGTKQKILDNGEIIHAHPHFRFAESMNIGYAGTNEMNISHKSRIQNKIKISKLPIDKMTEIIVKETDIDRNIARKMASLLDAFHNVILNEGNETTQRIDLRTLINWAHKTVDLDNDVIRASLVTIICELAEEDDDILNLEDVNQILSTNGAAATVMKLIVDEFIEEK